MDCQAGLRQPECLVITPSSNASASRSRKSRDGSSSMPFPRGKAADQEDSCQEITSAPWPFISPWHSKLCSWEACRSANSNRDKHGRFGFDWSKISRPFFLYLVHLTSQLRGNATTTPHQGKD